MLPSPPTAAASGASAAPASRLPSQNGIRSPERRARHPAAAPSARGADPRRGGGYGSVVRGGRRGAAQARAVHQARQDVGRRVGRRRRGGGLRYHLRQVSTGGHGMAGVGSSGGT